jgi:hypothetical protein
MRPLILLALVACDHTWHATREQMSPLPPLDAHASSTVGPLALEPGISATSSADALTARRITENRYLDRARIHEETAAFLQFVDTFFQPLTPETRIGFDQAHRELATLERLAPYSVYSVTLAFQQSTERLDVCIQNRGVVGSCEHDRSRVPARESPKAVFEVGEAAPGIGMLAVHDLRDADDPAWQGFAAATAMLAKDRALLLDLRDAKGADPRALLPWLAELTGRAEIKPLRAIERPPTADRYVAAYRARFADRGRDATIWSSLVARDDDRSSGAGSTKQPIAIVVGGACTSACELVARVLETYAGAIVIGGVTRAGRLARDEPAMFVLPHSQTSVYFYATRYLLAADIEAATGPTEEWHALLAGDSPDVDYTAFAIRDLEQRIAHPGGWPRCDALPSSIVDTPKLRGLGILARQCPIGYEITIQSDAPASVLERFFSTCWSRPDASSSPGFYRLRVLANPTPDLLSRIAASELVESVGVECRAEVHID